MALSTIVSQKKQIKRKAPRGFLKRVFKRQKPQLRLEKSGDLLVHLNCLLFVHRLAEESRTNACESKCRVINKEHVLAAAKVTSKEEQRLEVKEYILESYYDAFFWAVTDHKDFFTHQFGIIKYWL
ncbi:PREDICTED: centromere protein W [Rhinopithecus bieti]|uniref:centromere protein W n=1 Tax=Rhinopithecus bieti TaxID=61621 RepID=UPI00083BE1C1|nr:PREDICTED: centromere protein W [Rhinopithecus bieti]